MSGTDIALARALFGTREQADRSTVASVRTEHGVAVSDSVDGRVDVLLDMPTAGVSDAINCPTSCAISEGDAVLVYISGTTPVEVTVAGEGDRMRGEVTRLSATYGYCDSEYDGCVFGVACDGFELADGADLSVYFDITNDGDYFELDVNGTGRKPVMVNGETSNAGNQLLFPAGTTLTFMYSSGAFWSLDSPTTIYGASSSSPSAQNKLVTHGGCVPIMRGTTLNVYFGQGNTYDADWINLLVGPNSLDSINRAVYGGDNLLFDSDTTLTFTFTGSIWYFNNRSDASKTATTYITKTDANGITVHPSSGAANRIVVNADGSEIFRNNVSISQYGTTQRIGIVDQSHIVINPSSIDFLDDVETLASIEASNVDGTYATTAMMFGGGDEDLSIHGYRSASYRQLYFQSRHEYVDEDSGDDMEALARLIATTYLDGLDSTHWASELYAEASKVSFLDPYDHSMSCQLGNPEFHQFSASNKSISAGIDAGTSGTFSTTLTAGKYIIIARFTFNTADSTAARLIQGTITVNGTDWASQRVYNAGGNFSVIQAVDSGSPTVDANGHWTLGWRMSSSTAATGGNNSCLFNLIRIH